MSDKYVIKMPQLSDTMTEGVLVSWEMEVGEAVARGDVVATVETDKAIMDVEVFHEGHLSGPIIAVDTTVQVGEPIAFIVEQESEIEHGEREVTAVVKEEPKKTQAEMDAHSYSSGMIGGKDIENLPPLPEGVKATPMARKIADKLDVNLTTVTPAGGDKIITADDVINGIGDISATTQPATSAGAAIQIAEPTVAGNGRAMTNIEKMIANSMSESLSMPTFHVTQNAYPDGLIRAAKKAGVSITVAIAKACALAMQQTPSMNWAYQPKDKLVEHESVDIGMAVSSSDGGLVVPVLRDVASRSLEELNNEWRDLVTRARDRRLTPDEQTGATFMVSNMGMMGVTQFDAILTPGMAGILAIAANGEQGMPMTITADHRVVNGAEAATYMKSLKQHIEAPESWLTADGSMLGNGDWDYDVLVIGAGPGGQDCARDLAGHGVKVAMINDAPLPGGECLWRGCIPSKAWRAAADRMRDREHDAHLGVTGTTQANLDWDSLQATRRKVLETRGEMAAKADQSMKITAIQGRASFTSNNSVFVDKSNLIEDRYQRPAAGDGSDGEEISFGVAVVATGAPPFVPPISGINETMEQGGVLTSDTVWNLEQLPKRLGVIGGGAIGVEMAQIFQDFGTEVTLITNSNLLEETDAEIGKQLSAVLQQDKNLTIVEQAAINTISGKAGEVKIDFTNSDDEKIDFDCDFVILATGKRPVLGGLGLDKAGVTEEAGVIKVDKTGRTSSANIFAVGDVNGGYMLAHTAGEQGRVAANNILGMRDSYNQDKDCGVIFTRPQAAFVGLNATQAKEKGIDVAEVKTPISLDAKAMIANETHGLIKIVADKASHKIIGVHFLADHADTLIGEAVMMVSSEMTLEQVAKAIHPHPTQTEMFGDMARRLLSRLRRSKR